VLACHEDRRHHLLQLAHHHDGVLGEGDVHVGQDAAQAKAGGPLLVGLPHDQWVPRSKVVPARALPPQVHEVLVRAERAVRAFSRGHELRAGSSVLRPHGPGDDSSDDTCLDPRTQAQPVSIGDLGDHAILHAVHVLTAERCITQAPAT